MNKNIIISIVWFTILIQISLALKPAPASFYGYVITQQGYAPQGSIIEAYVANNTLCGSFVVKQQGRYGLLLCLGDDPITEQDEGAISGEEVTFFVNGLKAKAMGNSSWQSGVLKHIDLFLGNITSFEPITESPATMSGAIFIKIISIIASIILIIIFLWIYNKK